jgi:4-alpha-glucanotransferase
MRFSRTAGVLLHPTSLPGGYGVGDLGDAAYRFVDFLVKSGQSHWQVLPLGPTGYGDSPYACFSALAGNPLLIDLDDLAAAGDIDASELRQAPNFPTDRVDFGAVISFKMAMLNRAARRFREHASADRRADFERFCAENAYWLEDYVLFMALKDAHDGAVWNTWEWPLASREPEALAEARERLDETVFARKYFQYQFFRQWEALKGYANEQGLSIIGDIPIFVAYDSVDVWANPELYFLDENRLPTVVAGVPPDYFSPTGQLWGNPLYRWEEMAEQGYEWWISRVRQTLRMVDIIRLDHFRGFAAYWEVPAGEPNAINGHWADGPGADFFDKLQEALGDTLPLIAEDLGHITEDVDELREQFNLPGMKVLQFAFTSGPDNPYLPHNLTRDAVIYTGTHDNDTTMGWYESREDEELQAMWRYIGPTDEPVNWALMRTIYRSVASLAVVPLQDILGLGAEARMNSPGKFGGNWTWRFRARDLTERHWQRLLEMALTYGRKEPEVKQGRPDWM